MDLLSYIQLHAKNMANKISIKYYGLVPEHTLYLGIIFHQDSAPPLLKAPFRLYQDHQLLLFPIHMNLQLYIVFWFPFSDELKIILLPYRITT